jgi:7-cyano-7-deazaguanine synthase
MSSQKALVILSGGQDSTTCAAVACEQFAEVHAITFNYQQRHAIEIESAIAVALALDLASHEIITIGPVLKSSSPLVSNHPLGQYGGMAELPPGTEPTFIPGRNLLFLTLAANYAMHLGIQDIFIGVCEADIAGYWDCRQSFIDAMGVAIGEGMSGRPDAFHIHNPLMHLSKAESLYLAQAALGKRFDAVMALTHTCYAGVKGGCGRCHACLVRDHGFKTAGMVDPLWRYRQVAVA